MMWSFFLCVCSVDSFVQITFGYKQNHGGRKKGFFSCDFSRFHRPIWLVVMTIKSILICFGHDSVSVSAALYREVGVIEFSPKLAGSDGSFFS